MTEENNEQSFSQNLNDIVRQPTAKQMDGVICHFSLLITASWNSNITALDMVQPNIILLFSTLS